MKFLEYVRINSTPIAITLAILTLLNFYSTNENGIIVDILVNGVTWIVIYTLLKQFIFFKKS